MNIDVKNLTVKYGSCIILENLNVSIPVGMKLCLSGRSGSGKTTLLKALAGLIVPANGGILFDGRLVDATSVWEYRKHITYVSQEPDMGQGTVWERILQPFNYTANSHLRPDKTSVLKWFQKLHLEESLLEQDVSGLSGGQKQRIAIIIGFLLQRPILLLDEPVSAMDSMNKDVMKEVLSQQSGKTIVFISHDTSILDVADETIELADK